MYESFYQLSARPFLVSPLADRYFPAGASEYARETGTRCVERGEGPVLIMGAAGTGKSMVCQVLADQFRSKFRVAMLSSARLCTRRALLQNILFELRLPYREREEGELRLSLIDFLEPSERCPNGLLLVVDEAHTLPLRLLEELRMITNLVRNGQPRVRLVLAANLSFEERLASPRLESFNQRIAARCYLQSMSRDETCEYVRAQLRAVNGDPTQVFSEDAVLAIYRATDGIPRLVNQLGDHVLMMAAIGRRERIDAAGVEEAWADLQQLPSPWSGDQPTCTPGDHDILEFGELDGETVGELDGDSTDTPVGPVEQPAAEAVPVESHAAARLDNIEAQLASIDGTSNGDAGRVEQERSAAFYEERPSDSSSDFVPLSGQAPEVELVFHRAHDPFNEPFEQEEIVVGPAAVESVEPASSFVEPAAKPSSTIPFRKSHESHQEVRRAEECDPVLPESAAAPVRCGEDAFADSEQALPGDDRDLLEVFDDETQDPSIVPPVEKRNPRRREYRQLFATLRARS